MRKLFSGTRSLVAIAGAVLIALAAGTQLGLVSGGVGDRAANCIGMTAVTGCYGETATPQPTPPAQPTATPRPSVLRVGTATISDNQFDSWLVDRSIPALAPLGVDNRARTLTLAAYTTAAVFAEPDFKGTCTILENRAAGSKSVQLPLDEFMMPTTSSVIVAPDHQPAACQGLVLYDGRDYQGRSFFTTGSYPLHSQDFQRLASSVKVVGPRTDPGQPATWRLLGGLDSHRCSQIWDDVPNLATLGVGDNQATDATRDCGSYRPAKGQALTLYTGASYSGESVYVESDIADLREITFDDRAISLKIGDPRLWVALYSEPDYKGHCTRVAQPELAFFTGTAIGDRQVSSLKFWGTCYVVSTTLTSDPETFSWSGRGDGIWAFARANDNTLWMRRFDGTRWLQPESLGGSLTSGAAVASMGAPRIDVFVRGADGALYQKFYDVNGVWNGWHKLTPDNAITSDPAAVSWGPNRLDVFARGATGKLVHVWWGGNGWVIDPEGYLGDLQMTGGPAVASWGSGRLDVFVRTTGDSLYRKTFDGQWRAWQNHGDAIVDSDPAAVSWGPSRIDVFWKAKDGKLSHLVVDGEQSYADPAGYLGGALVSGPSASSRGAGKLDVFARTADGSLSRKTFDGQWQQWVKVI